MPKSKGYPAEVGEPVVERLHEYAAASAFFGQEPLRR